MRKLAAVVVIVGAGACAPAVITPEQAANICEEQARAAQGPTGAVSIGANTRSGPSASVAIGVTSDFIRGRDPVEVYETCVFERTGASPIRPPVLR